MAKVPRFVVALFALVASIFPAVEIGFFAYETYESFQAEDRLDRNTAEAILLFKDELDTAEYDGEIPEVILVEARAYWEVARDTYLGGDLETSRQALHIAVQRLQMEEVTILKDGKPIDLEHLLPPIMRAASYAELMPSCEMAEPGFGCVSDECYTTGIPGVAETEHCELTACRLTNWGPDCDVTPPMPANLPDCKLVQLTADGQWCQVQDCWEYNGTNYCDEQACIAWNDGTPGADCDFYFGPAYEDPADTGENCESECVDAESASGMHLMRKGTAMAADIFSSSGAPSFPIILTIIPAIAAVSAWATIIAWRR